MIEKNNNFSCYSIPKKVENECSIYDNLLMIISILILISIIFINFKCH